MVPLPCQLSQGSSPCFIQDPGISDHLFLQHDPFYSTFIADQDTKAQSRMPTDTPGGMIERTWALSGPIRTLTMALSLIDPVAEASPFIILRLALLYINKLC